MESYDSLLEAFEALNERKRWSPESMTRGDWASWKGMRCEIEKELFNTEPDPATDKRRFLRVPVTLEVSYWSCNELKDRYIPVLGEGGIFVSTVDPLPIGSRLDLEMRIAQRKLSAGVTGEVVWVNKSDDPAKRGMGIKFVDMTYDQKRMVYGLVDDGLRQGLLERRKFARMDTWLKVEFVYAEGQMELHTEDVSLGGLFISTDHLVPVGEHIRLVLHVPGRLPAVKVVAEVIRVVDDTGPGRPAGLGVRFLAMDPESEEAFRKYLGQSATGKIRPSSGGTERRRYTRLKRRVKLRFQRVQSFETVYTKDISLSGVFIQTHEPPPKGSLVEVSLIHPVTLQPLELTGRVVRVVEAGDAKPGQVPGVGITFEGMARGTLEVLRMFLEDFVLQETTESPEP